MKSSTALMLTLAATTAAISTAAPAQTTFFGEDVSRSEVSRLAGHPNADAACSNFFSHVAGVGTETFEGFNANANVPLSIQFPGSLNSTITATISASGRVLDIPAGTNNIGVYPVSGSKLLEANGSSFQLDFSAPAAAFGFYGVDIGDYGGQLRLEFSNAGANTRTYTLPHSLGSSGSTGGSVLYFGLIDTANPFSRVRFLNSAREDDFGFDDLTVGDFRQVVPPAASAPAVPEPGSFALLISLSGAGAALLARRRKRAK